MITITHKGQTRKACIELATVELIFQLFKGYQPFGKRIHSGEASFVIMKDGTLLTYVARPCSVNDDDTESALEERLNADVQNTGTTYVADTDTEMKRFRERLYVHGLKRTGVNGQLPKNGWLQYTMDSYASADHTMVWEMFRQNQLEGQILDRQLDSLCKMSKSDVEFVIEYHMLTGVSVHEIIDSLSKNSKTA